MASSTTKKVQVERWEREPLSGFVNAGAFATEAGVEFLSQSGSASILPYVEVKSVHFVRDFLTTPPDLDRRAFLARPKLEGLWVKLRFRDQAELEAILPNDLLQVESFGYTVVPPEMSGNTQRLFVPRAALVEMKVLGVIGSPLRRGKAAAAKDQIGLFE